MRFHYHRYLANQAKRPQDASNQLPDLADVSIDVFDEKEPQARRFRRHSCLTTLDGRIAPFAGTSRGTLLPVHVSLGK